MAHTMSPAECREFLAEGTRTGKLATVRADGWPHVAPVWFVLDGDALVFTTGAATVKGRNLARDGRVAITVDDERAPYAFVVVRGRVALSEDVESLRAWSTRIGGRYMGADRAEEFGARNGVPGELLVRVTPESVVGQSAVAE
ncbi:PPOX class F420-dependent oxidoreductase [Streptomyces radicis]|uniref:PPOX class F420-dependent oxidoreductase n=1 Tax=Streptomyces radicis TaxID=1750517 RepID=A0A3A9W841_9ACTN|nr:PPOX class F420-dependent oxidoreductase [Streptomyces radicis]RKN03706.1 PPOX class F420-dependent oxidoreductase [Streptomyces radicis]RKN13647.1 PPOX class F420-dependent oxidoreductase [Streptomyces radicis]